MSNNPVELDDETSGNIHTSEHNRNIPSTLRPINFYNTQCILRRSVLESSSAPSILSIDTRQQHLNEIVDACQSLKYFIETNIQSLNSFLDIGKGVSLLELDKKKEFSHTLENILSLRNARTAQKKKKVNNINRLPKVINKNNKKLPVANSIKLLGIRKKNKMNDGNLKNDAEGNSSLSKVEIDDEEKIRLISQLESQERQTQGINYELSDSRYVYRGWTVIEDNIPFKSTFRVNDKFNPNRMSFHSTQSTILSRISSGRSSVKGSEIEFERKLYRNGSEFSLIFNDQTGCIKYPSGELACLITRKGDNYLYTLFFRKDELNSNSSRNQSLILGSLQSLGKGSINDKKFRSLPKLIYNRQCGYLLNNGPQKILKKWTCSDNFPPNVRQSLRNIRNTKEYGIRRIRQKWYWTKDNEKELDRYFDTEYKRFLVSKISESGNTLMRNKEEKPSAAILLFQPIVCQLSQHWSIRLSTRDNVVITFTCGEKNYSLDVHRRYKVYGDGNVHNRPIIKERMTQELNQDTKHNSGNCNVHIFLRNLEKINKRIKNNEMKLKKSLNAQRY